MSATEEKIVAAADPGAVPPETPATATTVTVNGPPAPDPKDRHAVIKDAFERPRVPRNEHARFQPRDQGKFAGPPTSAPVTRPPRPDSLKKEIEPHWNAAPVELLQEIIRREEDHTRGVQPLKEAKAQLEELLQEFKPYESLIRAQGGTPKTVIQNLMQTANIFHTGTPFEKARSVAGLMQQFGIPLAHLQQLLPAAGQGQGGPPVALDPQFNALAQQVQQTQQTLLQIQQREQQQTEARALATVQKFGADPAHPHFEAVQERMLQLLQAPQVIGVDRQRMSYEEQLEAAYDTAIRLDPALSAQIAAAQQASQQQPAQVQKAKAAAVQVQGAPASGPAPKIDPKDRRAIIANAMARMR